MHFHRTRSVSRKYRMTRNSKHDKREESLVSTERLKEGNISNEERRRERNRSVIWDPDMDAVFAKEKEETATKEFLVFLAGRRVKIIPPNIYRALARYQALC